MQNLIHGLRTFTNDVYPQQKQLFDKLSLGQKPHTLIITCSDSRIDPGLVTQTQPGEIFVVRNAGNIIPPYGASQGGEEAAIEFAIDALGVRHVVICGHSHCGAMAALEDVSALKHLPSVQRWLGHAESTRRTCYQQSDGVQNTPSLTSVVEQNVLAQAANLKTHPAVAAALRENRIDIFGWVYHFDVGHVAVYNPNQKAFIPSNELPESMKADPSDLAL